MVTQDLSVHMVGVLDALYRHRLSLRPDWFISAAPRPSDELRRETQRLLRSADRPEAIICETDFMARVIEEEAIEQGLDIPRDMALVACDCSAYAEDAPVPISGVACSPHEVCQHAIEIIEQSLTAIDNAIQDARLALEGDPSNSYVSAHLAATMKRKVQLLQRVAAIAAAAD